MPDKEGRNIYLSSTQVEPISGYASDIPQMSALVVRLT